MCHFKHWTEFDMVGDEPLEMSHWGTTSGSGQLQSYGTSNFPSRAEDWYQNWQKSRPDIRMGSKWNRKHRKQKKQVCP